MSGTASPKGTWTSQKRIGPSRVPTT
jgi:hypothetical protein